MESLIKLEQVCKRFGKQQVLNSLNVSFKRGECIAVIGPNGCGKTTMIKSILGMVIPDSGKISFQGKDILHEHTYRNCIGYMPQIGRYPDNMSIGQVFHLLKSLRNYEGELDETLIIQFGLNKISDKKMNTLSGGTIQKVSASLAFMFHPEVLILDEPTAGLDPLSANILKLKIKEEVSKRQRMVIITSHILSELDELVSHILFMEEGRVRFFYNVHELMNLTGENRISKAITTYLSTTENV